MEFQSQQIVIETKAGQETTDAVVGVGSGLAYHLEDEESEEDGEDEKVYTLTHLLSGRTISEYGVDDEDVAQRWLELVASLADWNQDVATLQAQYSRDLQGQIDTAIDRAYVDVYGDPWEDEEDESGG